MSRRAAAQEPVAPRRRTQPLPAERPLVRLGRRALRGLLILAAIVLVIDALFGERGFVETMRARQEYDQLAASIARLKADNTRLREQARRLREDPSAVEDLARRELGLIRPGEVLFIVKDQPPRARR